jgi:DNA polymerase-3 subunit alpha
MQQHICSSPNCSYLSHKNRPLVNLHIHSPQSLLDGVGKTQDYIKLAKEYGHPGLAVTDHGNPAHLFDHYKLVKSAGLKPILGEEFYLALDLNEKIPNRNREVEKKDKHQTVLIKNKQGYKNFCKLTYLSFTEGYYAKPRINYDMLFENKSGLIVTSGCAASMFNQLLNIGKEKEAEEWFKRFVSEFGDDFYGEIQFNELLDKSLYGMNQKEMNDFIIKMCNKYDVPIIIGGDTHYAYKEDANLQDILITAQRRKDGVAEDDTVKDIEEKKKDFMIHARHLYYHQSEDYYKFNEEFGYNYDEKLITEALDNSLKILDKVDFDFDTKTNNFPKYNYDVKLYNSSHELLEKLAWEGLLKKLKERKEKGEVFTNDQITQYEKRLEIELEVIKEKEFTDYFLVVQDVVLWAKNNNIAVGPGRGSAAGALLSYSLSITEVDPIKHDLLFERFINKFREAKPDIDIDFEQGAREKIRHYLEDKYGKEAVLGVVTFHQYGPKSALQDISRGLKRDTSFQSTLMKEITKLPDLDEQKDLVQYFDNLLSTNNITPSVRKWILDNQDTIKYANKILDQPKNLGTHAGGILIAPGPVYNYIPVTRGGKELVTAFKEADGSSKDLSELGLLKLDVLGLKTLNVIYGSIKNIKEDLGIDITNDIRYINLEDPNLYELVRKGNLLGLFQLDGGALPLVKAISPTRFEDIVAINSLNRPGPLETFGPVYARWKRFFEQGNKHLCKEDNPEIFPRLDFMQEITEKNYYCMLHQEDFMQMVVKAADFNLGEADNFRRAIAWREDHPKYHTVKKYFDQLQVKMLEKGYSQADVDYFLDYCRKFSGYSFNASHSVSYAYIAMQCAYLKHYYPAYFYVHLLNVEAHENYHSIIVDALANGIKILPISLTKSEFNFKVEDNSIRIGFKALKGFGEVAYNELRELGINEHTSLEEILSMPFKKVNKAAFDALITIGVFDEFKVSKEKIEIIYNLFKDKKIETWFTRKRNPLEIKTMPESLYIFPEEVVLKNAQLFKDEENHWKKFILSLIDYVKVKEKKKEYWLQKEEELMGFSLDSINKINELITLKEKYPELNLQSLSSRESDDDLCYWYLTKKTVAKTAKGKEYLILDITDNNIKVKAKCWEKVNLEKNKAYVSNIKKDNWGYTIVVNEMLTEINLD